MNYGTQGVLFQAPAEESPEASPQNLAAPALHACPVCNGNSPLSEVTRRERRYKCASCEILFGVAAPKGGGQ